MTLQDAINKYEAAQPAPASMTPLGRAHVAAHHLSAALAALSPQDRLHILGRLVVEAPAGPDGLAFSLLVSHPPTPDPTA